MRRTGGYHFIDGGGGEIDSINLFDDPIDLEIDICESILKKVPNDIHALTTLGALYTQRGLFEKGLEIDIKLCRLRPDDPSAHYNLACSLSLLEKKDEAVDALEKAVDRGYTDYTHMRSDKDIDNIRDHPLYQRLVDRILARIKKGTRAAE